MSGAERAELAGRAEALSASGDGTSRDWCWAGSSPGAVPALQEGWHQCQVLIQRSAYTQVLKNF